MRPYSTSARTAFTVLLLGFAPSAPASWHVVCDVTSRVVVLTEAVDGERHRVMSGPLPSRRTAEIWLAESCPNARCDHDGHCAPGLPATGAEGDWSAGEVTSERREDGGAGGWVAGEVTSETLSGSEGGPPPVTGPAGLGGPAGPGCDGLEPLVENARTAVESCNYHAALLTADHMVNFDPGHPWLEANHQRLKDLALRQRATEDAVWQASSALSSGNLKRARTLAQAAADAAVSCQSRAVSELLAGIDAAIDHQRRVRAARNREAMAALLPSLLDLANAAIAASNGGVPAAGASSYGGLGAPSTPGNSPAFTPPDPCAFRYEYRNVWSPEPTCTCPGYRFDGAQHRCVK